ncbi:UNVERIFIED_CONTAM: hypothetical protein H355_000765, partial [Colinus virginianus]
HVMSVPPDLHQQYLQACQNLRQPENHFVARVLQEADRRDNVWTKGITLKIAGNNHLVPVQRVTDEDVQVLASVLCSAVFVTGLDLRYNVLTDVGVKNIATFLQVPKFSFLIAGCLQCGAGVQLKKVSLLSAFFVPKQNSTLRYLNLMFNDIGTSGAELIANALHRNETLLHLRMTGNKIGDKGGVHFASMLQVNCTLEKLDLGDCDLGTQCLIAIASVLTQNKAVKAVNLNRPLLYSQEPLHSLRPVDYSLNIDSENSFTKCDDLKEETTIHIALMLKNNSSLVELHLCKHGMRSLGVERLCEALRENCSLRYLDLSCNKITRDDVRFLGELLRQNQALEILDLSSNRIEDDGAICLGGALALYNRTLKALVFQVASSGTAGRTSQ